MLSTIQPDSSLAAIVMDGMTSWFPPHHVRHATLQPSPLPVGSRMYRFRAHPLFPSMFDAGRSMFDVQPQSLPPDFPISLLPQRLLCDLRALAVQPHRADPEPRNPNPKPRQPVRKPRSAIPEPRNNIRKPRNLDPEPRNDNRQPWNDNPEPWNPIPKPLPPHTKPHNHLISCRLHTPKPFTTAPLPFPYQTTQKTNQ